MPLQSDRPGGIHGIYSDYSQRSITKHIASSTLSAAETLVTAGSDKEIHVTDVLIWQSTATVELKLGFDEASATVDGDSETFIHAGAAGNTPFHPKAEIQGTVAYYLNMQAGGTGSAAVTLLYHLGDDV